MAAFGLRRTNHNAPGRTAPRIRVSVDGRGRSRRVWGRRLAVIAYDHLSIPEHPPMPAATARLTPEILYGHLDETLTRARALMRAAQCHGVLAGVACLNPQVIPDWELALYGEWEAGDLLVAECSDFLEALQSRTIEQLADPEFPFSPLLPADEQPLDQRLAALAQWCEGLLFGLGIAGLPNETELPPAAGEFLRDVTEISRVDTQESEADGHADFQYLELIEYLRAGCSLLFEEFAHPDETSDPGEPPDEAERS